MFSFKIKDIHDELAALPHSGEEEDIYATIDDLPESVRSNSCSFAMR
jgi:hypothetical protein